MDKFIEILIKVIPSINNPLSLIAFTVFVVVFLLSKLILKSNLIPPVRQSHGFHLLNKILNIAGISILLIIILAFAAYFYVKNIEGTQRSKNLSVVQENLDHLSFLADQWKGNLRTSSPFDRLKAFQPEIYTIGQLLEPKVAINQIIELNKLYKIPELTPVLLAISDQTLKQLFFKPFNYLPNLKNISGYYLHRHIWSLEETSENEENDLRYLILLQRTSKEFAYKDILYFLLGLSPISWDNIYEGSRFADAAIYVTTRNALVNSDYEQVLSKAETFINQYPNHRHTDDVFVLKTIAFELLGDPLNALRTAIAGIDLPDGDMQSWFIVEQFRIAERYSNIDALNQMIENDEFKNLKQMLRYTKAHHLAAMGNYKLANTEILNLIRDYPESKVCLPSNTNRRYCLKQELLLADIEKFIGLYIIESENASPEELFEAACKIFKDELIHYNRLHTGHRRTTYERVYPVKYYEHRNNFFVSIKILKRVIDSTTSASLKQRSYYKIGRSYQHLSYSSSFYLPTYSDGGARRQFAGKSIAAFLQGFKIFPEGELADDCLTEAGYLNWLLLGNYAQAEKLLQDVVFQYPVSNASDNALYHLARIYESRGEWNLAAKTWTKLASHGLKKKWTIISKRNLLNLEVETIE